MCLPHEHPRTPCPHPERLSQDGGPDSGEVLWDRPHCIWVWLLEGVSQQIVKVELPLNKLSETFNHHTDVIRGYPAVANWRKFHTFLICFSAESSFFSPGMNLSAHFCSFPSEMSSSRWGNVWCTSGLATNPLCNWNNNARCLEHSEGRHCLGC